MSPLSERTPVITRRVHRLHCSISVAEALIDSLPAPPYAFTYAD